MDEGNIIRSGASNGIVVLTQLRPISLVFTLPEQSLPEIQKQLSQGAMSVLAMDRDNERLSDLFDERNPAVRRSLERIVRGCRHAGVTVSICGLAFFSGSQR